MADRILAGKVVPGERFVDHGHERRCASVGHRQITPAPQRHADGREVAGRHAVEIHLWRVGPGRRPAVDRDALRPRASGIADRRLPCQRGGFHAGRGAQPLEQRCVELIQRRTLQARGDRIRSDDQEAAAREVRALRQDARQAAAEYRGARDQHERQRDLHGDQHLSRRPAAEERSPRLAGLAKRLRASPRVARDRRQPRGHDRDSDSEGRDEPGHSPAR